MAGSGIVSAVQSLNCSCLFNSQMCFRNKNNRIVCWTIKLLFSLNGEPDVDAVPCLQLPSWFLTGKSQTPLIAPGHPVHPIVIPVHQSKMSTTNTQRRQTIVRCFIRAGVPFVNHFKMMWRCRKLRQRSQMFDFQCSSLENGTITWLAALQYVAGNGHTNASQLGCWLWITQQESCYKLLLRWVPAGLAMELIDLHLVTVLDGGGITRHGWRCKNRTFETFSVATTAVICVLYDDDLLLPH